jgi:hypothetical protein
MQSLRHSLQVALAGLLLAACSSTPTVSSDVKPGQDFAVYKSFALLPLPEVKTESDPGLMLRVSEPARKTVIDTLVAKGFHEVEREQADFTVNVRGQAIPKVEVADWGYTHGAYARGYGAYRGTDVYSYEERTLAVEVYDQKSKEQVWVGWIKTDGYGRVEAERVCEGLRLILAEFPPKPLAARH